MEALHRVYAAGREYSVFFAAAVAPDILVEVLAQCLIAEMVDSVRVVLSGDGSVPVRSSQDMTNLLQCFPLHSAPDLKILLLPENMVPPQNISKGFSPAHPG